MQKDKKEDADDEEIVYHYCSVETFYNIIKNASIWLSDVEKSNDYQECVACRELVNERMQEYFNKDTQALKAWKFWYEKGVKTDYLIRTFAACFSESEDQLSQWRGYAQNGKGLAIGFDKKILKELNAINQFYIAFGKVIYDNIENYIDDIVEDNIAKLKYKGIGHVALELGQNYKLKFPFIKNSGFREEKEWRGVVSVTIGRNGNGNIPSSDKILFSKIKYRVSNDRLIPYIEMNFEKVKQSIIKKILIGPKSEIKIEDVFNFLYYCGYYPIEEEVSFDKPIRIKKSDISYR